MSLSSLRPRLPRRLVAVGVAGIAAFASPLAPAQAADEPIAIQDVIATPVTKASPCTVDFKDVLNMNTNFDNSRPADWFGSERLPSLDDVVRDERAGVNSDLCIGYRMQRDMNVPNRGSLAVPASEPKNPQTHHTTGDDQKDIVIDLPAGFAGSLANFEACSADDFGVDGMTAGAVLATCQNEALVGEAVTRISTSALVPHIVVGGAQRYVPDEWGEYGPMGAVWKLEAGPNELGRLGIQIYPDGLGASKPTKFTVRLTLAPDGSGRVRTTVLNAPRQHVSAGARDIYLEGVWLRMFGSKADQGFTYFDEMGWETERVAINGDFMETPTKCSTTADGPTARVHVTTYGGARGADPATYVPRSSTMDSTPIAMSGCEELPFTPSVVVETAERAPAVPTATTVRLLQGQAKVGDKLPALLKDASVTLPAGLELGAQAGNGGLPLCTAAAFAKADALTPNSCPAASAAADLTIISPLIDAPLVGKAYLGEQAGVGELPALYLEAAQPGATAPDAPRIKLAGTVTAGADGRITTTFRDNPQLRFSELRLEFRGGPAALFSTPRSCGTHTSASTLSAYNGAERTVETQLVIDQNCELPQLAPSLAVSSTNTQSGTFSPTQITIDRADRSPWLDDVTVNLPTGLLADLHVPSECAAAAAAVGQCPESSRIATVSVLAGAGQQPLPLTGSMYLVERPHGAVAGAVIVVRAAIGELDLGDVIVPGRIDLRPTDAGLTFSSDLPLRHRGLALNLRKVVVDVDRERFMLNPSACGPLAYSSAITGDGGQVAAPGGQIAYTGCQLLSFAPKIDARLTGEVRPGGYPGMWVQVTNHSASNLAATTVVLPDGVAAALKNIQSPCSRADFDAVRCPASTRVGSAVAEVAIAPEQIPGDIYLIRVPGETLPGLGLSFTGRFAQRVPSVVKINKEGRLITRFDAIPDLPLRKLTINVEGGPRGPLSLPPSDCANGTGWDATFTGWGGQVAVDETGLRCAARSAVSLSDRRGLSVRNFDFGGRRLKRATVTLPSGWSFNKRLARSAKQSWARSTGARVSRSFTARRITLKARAAGATDLRVKVPGSAVVKRSRSKKARTVTVTLRFVFTDGAVQRQQVRVRAR